MEKYFNKGKKLLKKSAETVTSNFNAGFEIVKDYVGELPVFVSLERSTISNALYDEKHYFVIPYKLSQAGFSLHSMRYLPEGVPDINDLPKRRVFHFPNDYYEGSLREHMLISAREIVSERADQESSSLDKLANEIDALDSKLTYGMLFVGGLAAVVNPLVGAAIVAKAILPSATGLISKYGVRAASKKVKEIQLNKEMKSAEEKVIKDFSNSDTLKVINPILVELELALNTTEEQHDPLIDPNLASGSIKQLDSEHWRELTERAVYHVYKDVYNNPSKHKEASLGPEDIRWFKVLFATLESN